MSARDNLHSRLVTSLKVILPLMALVLLSSLFLVARRPAQDVTLPFSERELDELASEQRVLGPDFSGVTPEGNRIEIAARSAVPRGKDLNVVEADTLQGRMETGDGSLIGVTSESGTVHTDESRAVLRGNVRIETSTGYVIETDELETSLNRNEMSAPGSVAATGPLGQIDAGALNVVSQDQSRENVSVVFKNGVKLIYVPQNQ